MSAEITPDRARRGLPGPRTRRRVRCAGAWLALALALGAPGAEAAPKRDDCFSTDSGPDETIAGCTIVINQRKRESNGDVAIAFYNRGLSYAKKDDHTRAVAEFSEAIKLDPSDPDTFRNRGESYDQLDQYERALKDLDQAVALDARNASNLRSRAWTYKNTGAYPKAIRDFDEAVRLDPKDSWAFYGRAQTYEKMEDPARALADLEAAARLDPDSDGIKSDLRRVRALAAARPGAPAATAAEPATLAEFDARDAAAADVWARLPLTVRRSVLTTEKAAAYGSYTARDTNVFAPGEPVVIYLEPVGYSWTPNADGTYGIGIVADYELVRNSGEILGGQKGVLEQSFTSRSRVREFFVTFTGTFTGLPAGAYTLIFTLHDKGRDQRARVEQPIVIKG